MSRIKIKKKELAQMSQPDAIMALRTAMPLDAICSVVAAVNGCGKKGDYTANIKLMVGSVCWHLISEGHSKGHVALVFDRHFTWVDSMIKAAVFCRSSFLDDTFALAFLREHIVTSDVGLIVRALRGVDPSNKKVGIKLFEHYAEKHSVSIYQLSTYFDLVLYRHKLIKVPTTGDAYTRARAELIELRNHERRVETKRLMASRSHSPFTFMR